jgi:hypothetical protein
MNDHHLQPTEVPSLDEDLVAYLDGELDGTASRRLEDRLATDPTARERLRALATSWDLLDHLPRADLDEAFTRTTVELVVSEARKEIEAEQAAIPFRKRRRWVVAAVLGLAAAMIGFVVVVVTWPDANERLLRDLPVVQNVEWYEVLPRDKPIEFLRSLENEFASEAAPDSADLIAGSKTSDELAMRRERVESLPAEKKHQLRKLYERFQTKPAEERARLRGLDEAIRTEPDAARLLAVLESYHNWLTMLTPLERAKLLNLGYQKAIDEIELLKSQQLRRFARSIGPNQGQGPLKQADLDTIDTWFQELLWKRKDEILSKASVDDRSWFENLPGDRQKQSLKLLTWQPGPPKLPEISDEDWKNLLAKLPVVADLFKNYKSVTENYPAIKNLDDLSNDAKTELAAHVNAADTPEKQRALLFRWQFDGMRARDALTGAVSREELQRFFEEELSDQEREELLSGGSPAEIQRRLGIKYFLKKQAPPGFSRGHWKGWGRRGGRGGGPDGGSRKPFAEGHRGAPPDFDRDNRRRDEGFRPRPDGGDSAPAGESDRSKPAEPPES